MNQIDQPAEREHASGSEDDEPTIATGIHESDELNRPATRAEIRRDETTVVTQLTFDEVDAT
ncbi:MAG: hypothetical protein JWN30_1659 [Bacilli bacterium]|nr:hypothetical protein [Bacilli bacterium]